jgi:hypothetical protein
MPSEAPPTSRSTPEREPRLLIVRSFRQLIAMNGILGASFCRLDAFAWRRAAARRHQAADWISPDNAESTASSRSASVKRRCSRSRAMTRSRKTPCFSTGTRSAAARTVRSCESVKANIAVMVSAVAAMSTISESRPVGRRTSHHYCTRAAESRLQPQNKPF